MQRSVKKLRPKANKLFSFSANWKRANRDLNIELGEQLLTLAEKETFPKAIEMFFEIKLFKDILKNLSKGSMWKDVYVFTDEDHHPPKEIQKVQNITSAFQKLCSIAHYPNYPDDPKAKAQLLTENIHDYLFIIYKLKTLNCKVSKKIKKHIIDCVHLFLKELKKTLKNKKYFKDLDFIDDLKILKAITADSITFEQITAAHRIIAALHICSETDPVHVCHKILNQMHKEIELVFDAISKNAPFFLPYAIKKAIHDKMKTCTSTDEFYNSLVDLFNDSKYEIIETKQQSHLENVFESCITLHILEKSLEKIQEKDTLPEAFKQYYNTYYSLIKEPLSKIEEFNSQVGYFLSGFYETQTSYLLELLNNPSIDSKASSINSLDITALNQKIVSFIKIYAQIKPELHQADIKQAFTNNYIKELSYEDAKSYIKNTFSFILPEKDEDTFISLEKASREILTDLLAMYKLMNKDSYPATLLKEKIKGLYLMDIPSFGLGWYLFGEIVSVLFILSSLQKRNGKKIIENFLIDVYQHPIFSVLLNTKSCTLPKILIKLQMI